MSPAPRLRAMVFDLDGTLIDSAPDLHLAANRMLAELGAGPLSLAQIKGFIGNGVPKLVARALRAAGVPAEGAAGQAALARFHALYLAEPVALTRPYPGVETALARLARAGIAMAICTNKPEAASREVLDRLGLAAHFQAVIGGDSLAMTKPDPAPLRQALSALAAPLGEALYVGDSETDEATALNAGMRFALFTGGYRKKPVEAFEADLTFDDFARLPELAVGAPASQPP